MNAYFTIVCARATAAFTNEWNNFSGCDWTTQTRGCFATEQAACEWARDHLIHGAPFTILYVPAFVDDLGVSGLVAL